MSFPTPARSRRRSRLLALPALLSLIVFACLPGPRPPDVPPSGTLSLRGQQGGDEDQGPLRVVFASPKGKLSGPSEITVLFSKPIRALDLAGQEPAFPASIEPKVEGSWQWAGTRAATFVPARAGGGGSFRLPRATSYTVTVPAGVKAIDGDTLAAPFSFSFETERPKVVRTVPYAGARGLEPSATFQLQLDQPAAPTALASALSLTVEGKAVEIQVQQKDPSNDKLFEVKPSQPLALASDVTLEVKKGLVGKEGALPSLAAQSFAFETYGPLAVDEVRCGYEQAKKLCNASGGARVVLSNPVKAKDLKRAISVSPPVAIRWPSWMDDDDEYESIDLNGRFLPGKTYSIRVAPPLVDRHGQALAAAVDKTISFGDVPALARIGVTDGVLEAGSKRELSVGHINVDDLEVGALKLSEEDILALVNDQAGTALEARPGFSSKKVARGRKNVVERHVVSLDEVLGKNGRGAFGIAAWYTSESSKVVDRSVVQLTDLAISAKVSRLGTVVFVTELGSAQPVKEAEVKIRRPGAKAATAKTDAQGMAMFSASDFTPKFEDEKAVVFVKKGDDSAYKAVADNVENWEFDPDEDGLIGLVFDDRGVYRPGDTVHVKGVLREPTPTGSKLPAVGKPISVQVSGPDGEKLTTVPTQTTAFGTFSVAFKLPVTGRLGAYSLSASTGGDVIASDSFEVAEYRASEFKVAIESDRPSFVRGDRAQWTARGDYLYGAPMKAAPAELSVTRSEASFIPKGAEEFELSDRAYLSDLPDKSPKSSDVLSSQVALDDSGVATASAKLDLPGQIGTERLLANVDVTDVTRQVISGGSTALVHPAEHYVGISLADRFVDSGAKLAPKFIAVKPDGERVAGHALKVELYKRVWAVAKQGSGAVSATTVSQPVDSVVASCALVSSKQPVGCELPVTDAGQYVLRVSSEDRRKNSVHASTRVYVSGSSSGKLAAFDESDRADVEIVRDKSHYKVGDKARLLIKSPWRGADAIVTVERAGVFSQRRVKLSGAAPTVEIPVSEDMRPNAYVSVLVHKPRGKKAPDAADKPDVGAPAFRLGYAQLLIDPEEKRLHVTVTPAKVDHQPGEEAVVSLKVKDSQGQGKKVELTLIAADEGVLSLVGYQLPDPVETFGAPRALHVATLESRERLAQRFDPLSGLGLDKGLDGGGGGDDTGASGARKDFRASAYFNPSLVTNENGEAEVKFKLPDSLTTYRLMAIAVSSEDRFGRGESMLTTSRPLMARPALPRFLRAGDTFDAAVVVSSKSDKTQEVSVSAKLTGVVLSGDAKKTVSVDPGKSVEVRFSASAPRVGNASFAFAVDSGTAKDSVFLERRVAIPMVLESVALYGNTSTGAKELLGDLSSIRDDAGELTVTTASTALVGLDAGSSQLLDYPYGCTEQLTSRLVPLIGLKDLAKDFKLTLPANLDDVVDKTVAKILAHQRYDGGFGFWADSPKASAWATTYALWGLHQAKRSGRRVPDSAIEDARRYLSGALNGNDPSFAANVGPFALYVLAELGKPEPGRVTKLFENRSGMPVFSKALLLSAAVLSQNEPGMRSELASELEAALRVEGEIARTVENLGSDYAVYLDSDARTSALVLRALLHHNPDHSMAQKLALGLLKERDGGAWRTTQESAWALLALGDYRRAQEKVEPNFVARTFFGDDLVGEHSFKGRSVVPVVESYPAARLLGAAGTALSFQLEGEGKLFYGARLRYAKKKLPTDVIDRGFFVQHRYRKVTAQTLDEALATVPNSTSTQFEAGDLVLADVVVVTPQPRRFVAIDDPLPAGFEAIDTRLSTTSDRLRGIDTRGVPFDEDDAAMERAEWSSYYTREVRDDRVLFFVDAMAAGVYRYRYLARATAIGAYITPPISAQAMYAPEIFGRAGSETVTVTAK